MKPKIKVAVVGVGYLGRFHAKKYARLKNCELVGVVDLNQERAQFIAQELGVKVFASHHDLAGQVQAVSVVTPTTDHYTVVRDLLSNRIDVLCEKPITTTLEEADSLINLANINECILQIGHLERFNPAVEELFKHVNNPLFIECNRIAPFKARATDVDVALDLMIHDIDIILSLVGTEPNEIRAVGIPILSHHPDIVNARLEFPNGCIANITASRLALKDQRTMRIFQPNAYIKLDFKKPELLIVTGINYKPDLIPIVKSKRPYLAKSNSLENEIKSFLDSVRTRCQPRVNGAEARKALACTLAIHYCVQNNLYGHESILEIPRRWVNTYDLVEEY